MNVTIAQCLARSSQLNDVSDSSRLDVEIILAQILNKNRTYLFTWPEKLLSPEEQTQFNEFFARRLTGEPVAHIVGYREFWALPIMVNSSTLIPRPDTELLVETVLNLFNQDDPKQVRRVLDLGTGTGAIALAIAHEKKSWQVLGADQSPQAVDLANKNKIALKIDNVLFCQSDWFSQLAIEEKFNAIVSNPPYIDSNDLHLNQGDVRFEPKSALVSGNNGLANIEIICSGAPKYLKNGAYLLIEHGYQQAEAVQRIFKANGFSEVRTLKDFGGNYRITLGQLNHDE